MLSVIVMILPYDNETLRYQCGVILKSNFVSVVNSSEQNIGLEQDLSIFMCCAIPWHQSTVPLIELDTELPCVTTRLKGFIRQEYDRRLQYRVCSVCVNLLMLYNNVLPVYINLLPIHFCCMYWVIDSIMLRLSLTCIIRIIEISIAPRNTSSKTKHFGMITFDKITESRMVSVAINLALLNSAIELRDASIRDIGCTLNNHLQISNSRKT